VHAVKDGDGLGLGLDRSGCGRMWICVVVIVVMLLAVFWDVGNGIWGGYWQWWNVGYFGEQAEWTCVHQWGSWWYGLVSPLS